MSGKASTLFCEVHHAARVIGVETAKIEGWLVGGMLAGTFSGGRWLANIESVRRLHLKFHREGKLGSRTFLAGCTGEKLCDRIAESNLKLEGDIPSPKRSKLQKNLLGFIQELCMVATPGQRPSPKKPSGRKLSVGKSRHRTQRVNTPVHRALDKKTTQQKNARAFALFQKNRAERFGDGKLPPIDHKRFWWNEE